MKEENVQGRKGEVKDSNRQEGQKRQRLRI